MQPNSRTELRQTPERNCAKLPNGIVPNSRLWGINYCMEGNYKHRVVDALLERKLLGKGAVLVEGAKWCGVLRLTTGV